jgi:hypothetical protein
LEPGLFQGLGGLCALDDAATAGHDDFPGLQVDLDVVGEDFASVFVSPGTSI